MRCKKHLTDLSSSVGVCATCLRDRLFSLIAAQAQAEASLSNHRNSDAAQPPPPPLIFPRSVSPYVSKVADRSDHQRHQPPPPLFYSTPQVGRREKCRRLSLIPSLFRSTPKRTESDPCATSSSTSWLRSVFSGGKKKNSRLHSMDESTSGGGVGGRRMFRGGDRGMSPARVSDCGDDDEFNGGSSGYSSESWRQTPRRAIPPPRRGGGGRSTAGFAFCLSPLVRPSPNRRWNSKSMPTEIAFSGDMKGGVAVSPHLATAASFYANRSRKIADFGRFNPRH